MKNRRLMIFLILTLLTGVAAAQNAPESDRINDLATKLSWQSTRLEYNFLIHIRPNDEAAAELIKIGQPATDALLAALRDERKARAAHLILYVIWINDSGIYPVISNAAYKRKLFKKKISAVDYEFYGLKWTLRGNENHIDQSDLEKTAANWGKTIAAFQAESGK